MLALLALTTLNSDYIILVGVGLAAFVAVAVARVISGRTAGYFIVKGRLAVEQLLDVIPSTVA